MSCIVKSAMPAAMSAAISIRDVGQKRGRLTPVRIFLRLCLTAPLRPPAQSKAAREPRRPKLVPTCAMERRPSAAAAERRRRRRILRLGID
ncbi:MAG: hypothetical protein K8H87_05630, partial [Pseudorhodoplanes sp.]|nr:hypothetical protein [Pseudorhodoplanes sp.]